jgi:hypothetical protein
VGSEEVQPGHCGDLLGAFLSSSYMCHRSYTIENPASSPLPPTRLRKPVVMCRGRTTTETSTLTRMSADCEENIAERSSTESQMFSLLHSPAGGDILDGVCYP